MKKAVVNTPKHIAIILDGNGRWAKRRGMPRTMGHQAGVRNIKTIALAASRLGIQALSVFAFSTENWNRPQAEVDYLMTLPQEFERLFDEEFERQAIRLMFSGRRSKLSPENLVIMERLESSSASRKGMVLNICFDYGAYDELTRAMTQIAAEVQAGNLAVEAITPEVIEQHLDTRGLPALDLLIRTSGEIRLSNFLLWQAGYAELAFVKVPWPAFSTGHLLKILRDYAKRDRRFGRVKG